MNNIYQASIQAVEDGANFRIDFQSRSLKLNGKFIIQDGRYEGELGVTDCNEDEFFANVEELYSRYKNSVPSERSESKPHQYFMAVPERSLSDDAMLYGERRDKAQIELAPLATLLTASITYLVMLEEFCPVYNGIPLNNDTGWRQIIQGIDTLIDKLLQM